MQVSLEQYGNQTSSGLHPVFDLHPEDPIRDAGCTRKYFGDISVVQEQFTDVELFEKSIVISPRI